VKRGSHPLVDIIGAVTLHLLREPASPEQLAQMLSDLETVPVRATGA
jgi:hypothetical protein